MTEQKNIKEDNAKKNILIQPIFDNYEKYSSFAASHDLKFEIIDFALPMTLDNRDECRSRIDFYKSCENQVEFYSMHGVYNDMRLHSVDRKIREVTEERLEHNCKIARELGINKLIFHTNYVPQNSHEVYFDYWVERNADFFKKMIEKYEVEILLENVFDYFPWVLQKLMEKVRGYEINVCFDIGHYNIHSRVSLREWFSTLGKNIKYLHLNDNRGEKDLHAIPGTGNVKWQRLTGILKEFNLTPPAVLEVDIGNLSSLRKTLSFMREENIYPFS